MNPNELNATQFNILSVSAIRCLIRSGALTKEDLIAEMAQQGIPAEWAKPVFDLIQSFPDRTTG